MAASVFDQNLSKFQADFKALYGVAWNLDKPLFTQYMIARYASLQLDITSQGINVIGNDVKRVLGVVEAINNKLTAPVA
ncbi:MAG: hypothetical protein IT226_11275 [Flavobacteriales bacterium]|nr:hypothetical protein [Flavobacteriales bacterium]